MTLTRNAKCWALSSLSVVRVITGTLLSELNDAEVTSALPRSEGRRERRRRRHIEAMVCMTKIAFPALVHGHADIQELPGLGIEADRGAVMLLTNSHRTDNGDVICPAMRPAPRMALRYAHNPANVGFAVRRLQKQIIVSVMIVAWHHHPRLERPRWAPPGGQHLQSHH